MFRGINDSANPSNTPCFTNGKRANKNRNATAEAKCRDYLESVVEYCPGTQLRHADAPCRAVQAVTQDLEISRDEVKKAQAEDKFCQSLKPGPASGKAEYFTDEGGLIFRRRKKGENQLVVPLSLARRLSQPITAL